MHTHSHGPSFSISLLILGGRKGLGRDLSLGDGLKGKVSNAAQNVYNCLSVDGEKESFVIKAQIPQNASYRSFRINDFCYLTEQKQI